MVDYKFDGIISKEVLENYLSKSVTAAGLVNSDSLEDDLRVIKNISAKFLGRATGIWEPEPDDLLHFENSKKLADVVHKQDSEIILQACIFEAVYKEVKNFAIPQHVFVDFGLSIENRNFSFEDMLFPEKPKGFVWKNEGGIPDLNRLETQLWFYYRATAYIDAGYEAFHMGQIHLYTANDIGFVKTQVLFKKIREYASKNARRHMVLLDAHTHGVNIDGKLLFDYHAMPFTRIPLLEKEGDTLVLIREGISEGGVNPNGWSANAMPYLMEYDNWGGKLVDDFDKYTREERAWMDWWGYDQIAWFASLDEENRNHFLEYTYKWTSINNVNAYFEAPLRRGLGGEAMMVKINDSSDRCNMQDHYRINTQSEKCRGGFSQEEVLKKLWEKGDKKYRELSNPWNLLDYGAKNEFEPITKVKIPEKIVVYGSFQSHVGAIKNDSSSETTRMYYVGNQKYRLAAVMPFSGTFDFAISTYGTLSATYCDDSYPRSGSSNKSNFTTTKDNMVVIFNFEIGKNIVSVEIVD